MNHDNLREELRSMLDPAKWLQPDQARRYGYRQVTIGYLLPTEGPMMLRAIHQLMKDSIPVAIVGDCAGPQVWRKRAPVARSSYDRAVALFSHNGRHTGMKYGLRDRFNGYWVTVRGRLVVDQQLAPLFAETFYLTAEANDRRLSSVTPRSLQVVEVYPSGQPGRVVA